MKKNFLIGVIIVSSLVILPFRGYSLEGGFVEEIRLYLGEPKIIPVSSPTRIAVGNPSVADVTNATSSEITLGPKAVGTTSFMVWDNFGEHSYRIKVLLEDINEIKRRVDNLLAKINLPEVHTQAEEDEGKVLLLGRVKSAQDREKIALALGALKDKTLDLIEVREDETIVEIEAQVLELDRDATRTLGFTWPSSLTFTEKGSPGIADAGVKWESSDLFKVVNLNRSALTLTVDALAQEGKARILSRPRLACQSGKEAELLVGGEKPIFTTQVAATGGEGTEVEYKEYGIKMKIKPTVTDDKRIKLSLNVDITEAGDAETIGSSTAPTAKAYPMSKRTATTELFIDDGQTLAIGGLIKQKKEVDVTKTSILGDIPVLGFFFKKTQTKVGGGQGERGNQELFITITPTIIKQFKEAKRAEKENIAAPATQVLSKKPVSDDPFMEYANVIKRRVMGNLAYPSFAKDLGFQGTVKLSLHLSYRGELLDIKVKEPSGYKMLDEHAVSTAKTIASYPPFPASIEPEDIWIDIPIAYHLD